MEQENQSKPNFLELYRTVGKIEQKLIDIDEKLDKNNKEICERVKVCEGCILTQGRDIENFKGKASVYGAVGGFVSAIISAITIWWITK